MKKMILIHLFLLTMVLVTSSCSLAQIEEDPLTILEMKTCEPPCWQGITPGVTTLEEANILTQQITYVPSGSDILEPDRVFTDGIHGINFRFREPYPDVEIFANEQGVIDRIVFLFDRKNLPKLGDCTEIFGEPQFIGMSVTFFEARRSFIIFAYSQITLQFSRGMAFRLDPVKISYSSNVHIESVTYHSEQIKPTDFEYYFPWKEKAILQFEKNY